ncbi:uncharacterized protein LOC121898928 [Thunnus maccoyii]|uniref:uncharacterized protein LOC121898928 n=1 Tax=Thunnus maccoyii TaxID=8240 RepID=UPI001C4B6C72|nr:uncharacterized protein LOC121898928 [Thunnus maccoyii]
MDGYLLKKPLTLAASPEDSNPRPGPSPPVKIKTAKKVAASNIDKWKIDWHGVEEVAKKCQRRLSSTARHAGLTHHQLAWNREKAIATLSKEADKSKSIWLFGTKHHRFAYDAWSNQLKEKEFIVDAVCHMKREVYNRMVKLFDISYHIAKHEKPFAYFPALITLEKRHGVELEDAYKNPKQAQIFTQYLADEIQDEITKQIRASRYISILVDGSSTLEKEVLYCKFLENSVPVMKFLGVKDTAEGILECVQSLWTSKNMP